MDGIVILRQGRWTEGPVSPHIEVTHRYSLVAGRNIGKPRDLSEIQFHTDVALAISLQLSYLRYFPVPSSSLSCHFVDAVALLPRTSLLMCYDIRCTLLLISFWIRQCRVRIRSAGTHVSVELPLPVRFLPASDCGATQCYPVRLNYLSW